MGEPIYAIEPEHLTREILAGIVYPDLKHNYYWSDRWEPAFYRDLARAAFISTGMQDPVIGPILLPEIQFEYAVLDWENRRLPASFARWLRGNLLEREAPALALTREISPTIAAIQEAYGEKCWLGEKYASLMRELAAEPLPDFELLAVELRAGAERELVSGELGYRVGNVYTSLSGFLHRDRRRWNNMGKLQLHALARVLEEAGIAFWNLGHPYMQYKIDLGARVLPRARFLERWNEHAVLRCGRALASETAISVDRRFFSREETT